MARKPRDFAKEYAARTRGKAKGTPEYAAARGHAVKTSGPQAGKSESQRRRERERIEAEATGKLTTQQRTYLRKFAREKAEFAGTDPDEAIDLAISWATRVGYPAAKAEIAKSGYAGQKDIPLTLTYVSGTKFEEELALLMQANLEQIGFKVTLGGEPWNRGDVASRSWK